MSDIGLGDIEAPQVGPIHGEESVPDAGSISKHRCAERFEVGRAVGLAAHLVDQDVLDGFSTAFTLDDDARPPIAGRWGLGGRSGYAFRIEKAPVAARIRARAAARRQSQKKHGTPH